MTSCSGIHRTKKIDKVGMRSSDTAQIFFEDVRVPQDYIIGEEGMGFTYQMIQFQAERMWGTAAGTYEPRCEKTGLQDFRPGPTQSRL